ncbi:MAG: hypothetical protein F6K61_16120 [Sphaerospermopsis sp. SIO1G1]|nr:hypothetical protein [Sphaerospermopsis sp. SIO1G1]
MLVSLLSSIDAKIRISSIVVLCVVAILALVTTTIYLHTSHYRLKVDDYTLATEHIKYRDQNAYVLPNYGAPDSNFGSGTR